MCVRVTLNIIIAGSQHITRVAFLPRNGPGGVSPAERAEVYRRYESELLE